ncbi:MAG TPA: alpha/beta fold hydrolase [Blastocatellia bacterium]|nr:alpha/beta fold hydrolase [Blastocatellia bacterium]
MILSKKTRVLLKRIFWVFVPAVLVLGLGAVGLSFYLIHRLSHPQRTQLYGSPRDFQVIMQKPMWSDEKWKNSDSTQSVGWFLSQNRTAPAIILSHSYESNRSELLTLSFELWKAGYHVLVYDLRGHGESPVNWSGLGTYENDDLLSAIKFVKGIKSDTGQVLVDGRIGLYGAGLGGYISLVASSQDPMVKAVAVDSVYPDVDFFINHRLKSFVGSESEMANRLVDSPWTASMTKLAMQVYLMRREDSAPAVEAVGIASGRRLLFITGKDAGGLVETTKMLFGQARDNKEIAEVEATRLDRLYDQNSSNYDARVVSFFREALPTGQEKTSQQLKAAR